MLDEIHEGFVASVSNYCGDRLPLEKEQEVANERGYNGEKALELGLVDYLGGLK